VVLRRIWATPVILSTMATVVTVLRRRV
jgi:hypothetical protein